MRRITMTVLALLTSSCATGSVHLARPELVVVMKAGSLSAPDSIAAGFTRLRFHLADSTGHNLAVFALPDGVNGEAFIAALDTIGDTPAPTIARGGLESPIAPGDTASAWVEFQPGRYLIACLSRDSLGHRHASSGQAHWLTVTAATGPNPAPTADVEVRMTDFAFDTPGEWKAGHRIIRLTNEGSHDHMVILQRLHEGVADDAWLRDEDGKFSDYAGGATRLGPGQSIALEVDLVASRYGLVCLIGDARSGKMHIELGMGKVVAVAEK